MKHDVRVIPAILTDNPETLQKMLRQTATFTDYVQIDIMDGRFVPSVSITWEQIKGVPQNLKWEVHLMVEQPERYLENYRKAGAVKAIFHYEATDDPEKVIARARNLGLKVGLAVNPETPVLKILPLMEKIDGVLFLAVHPGFYGAKLVPEVMEKIAELRRQNSRINIGIDGGVKENNVGKIALSGVNEIFVGSAILLQPDPAESHRKLTALVQAALKNS